MQPGSNEPFHARFGPADGEFSIYLSWYSPFPLFGAYLHQFRSPRARMHTGSFTLTPSFERCLSRAVSTPFRRTPDLFLVIPVTLCALSQPFRVSSARFFVLPTRSFDALLTTPYAWRLDQPFWRTTPNSAQNLLCYAYSHAPLSSDLDRAEQPLSRS